MDSHGGIPFGPQAPVALAAWSFAEAYWVDKNMELAWVSVDPLLRRCWTQAWLQPLRARAISDGFDPDEVVEAFADAAPQHPLWHPFARRQVEQATLPVTREGWGVKVHPEIVAPDVELVRLMPVPEGGELQPNETYASVPLLMRYDAAAGWRVLNFVSDAVPTPGWPPTME
ncbi:hypothetical protein ABTX99_07670 [Streptomyces flaveolus]|uniref:hypothetical protein n=1 Tax=Streptomyces flaveolus TaxID=67297 RepID=UPI00332541A3